MSTPEAAVEQTARLQPRGLLERRLAMLERATERAPIDGARRALLASMLQRLRLLARMIERIGVGAARPRLVGLVVREAEANCMSCPAPITCRRWLDAPPGDDAYRDFCPNAARFDGLPQAGASSRHHPARD